MSDGAVDLATLFVGFVCERCGRRTDEGTWFDVSTFDVRGNAKFEVGWADGIPGRCAMCERHGNVWPLYVQVAVLAVLKQATMFGAGV